MRSALGISLAIHVLISVIAFHWVSFRKVQYIQRQVYTVSLVTPAVAETKPPEPEVKPPEPEPEVTPPEPEPEPEPPPPQPVPKPKAKPKQKRKEIPKTEIEKTQPPTETPAEPQDEAPPETGEVSLDTDDFPFGHYINRMRRKIAASWRPPAGVKGEDRFCRIYFRVGRDGNVSSVNVEESSGIFMFDQAAQRAVLQAAPMPPLPREYRDAYLGVHFSFAYKEKR